MDFCQLLHTAKSNDKASNSGVRYYSTKFEPPKKVKKENKKLSDNIKKFLAKKEAEEQKKVDEAKKKKDELLALRAQDKKATRRVNVMLKRTKSANQAVIEDAVDKTHTAVTRAGPEQPDEDDYGYVSQEASALYEKMMEKYSQMPEEPKFKMFKKKVDTNINSTKERVRAALEKEREEAMLPHKRKRKKKETSDQTDDKDFIDDSGVYVREEWHLEKSEKSDKPNSSKHGKDLHDSKEFKEPAKPKPKPKPAPPPMSFAELLKMAEKKQHEPILIEQKPKDEERPLTKKQKKEMEQQREWRERKEERERERERAARGLPPSNGKNDTKLPTQGSTSSKAPEKGTSKSHASEKPLQPDRERDRIPLKQPKLSSQRPAGDSFKNPTSEDRLSKSSSSSSSTSSFSSQRKSDSTRPVSAKDSSLNRPILPNGSVKNGQNRNMDQRSGYPSKPGVGGSSKDFGQRSDIRRDESLGYGKFQGKPKEFPPRDLLPKGKPKEFPPRDLKPKQFPLADVRGIKRKEPVVNRGRILDDSDEDEYDSELDDFIDDGPEEDNYSSYIKEIFGYDKSKYKDMDDDVDNMESSFAQQMKEEVISTKIGIMEDLEDIKKEEEEKRRKALMKKKMMRR